MSKSKNLHREVFCFTIQIIAYNSYRLLSNAKKILTVLKDFVCQSTGRYMEKTAPFPSPDTTLI